MNSRILFTSVFISAALGFSAAWAQQRVEFPRQTFDRTRFERPGQAAAPAEAAPVEPAEPVAPTAPVRMATEPPRSSSIFSTNSGAGEFAAPGGATPSASSAESTNTAIFSADAVLAPRPPGGPSYPANATPEEKAVIDAPLFDQIPSKTFGNAKDHDELVALQKKTGACLVVYFKNFAVPNEKGLCSWFEKTVTSDIQWRRAMKYYIQLTITVPGTSAVEELQAKYRANKSPSLFVVKPGSTMPVRIKLFDYANGTRPTPVPAEEVVAAVKAASTPAYQTLF